MKKTMLLLGVLLVTVLLVVPFSVSAADIFPNSGANGLTGFAGQAKNEKGQNKNATTGGVGGKIVYVSTIQDLKQHLSTNVKEIIVIQKNISTNGKTKVDLGSNKTLVGSYKHRTLNNIYLAANQNSSNIIFQNITLVHDASINANDDIQMYLNYGQNYWIDHVTFAGHNYDPNGHDLDKLLYVGVKADYVTISNSKFSNHRYGLILGYPDDNSSSGATYDGYPHMTIANNYFDNLTVRAPGLMRYGFFHVKNNYINNFNLGFTLANHAKIYSEANYFGEGSQRDGALDDKGNGQFIDVGSNVKFNQKSPVTSWNPHSNYAYKVNTAQYAKDFTQKYAGSQNTTLIFGQ